MKRLALLAIVPALVVFGCSSGDADVAASDTALAPDTVIVIDLHSPFDFPLVLAGNFGELRPYHFHGGIDFKTQGSTGHPIHCAERGYVSAVEVGPWGYGRAIFVTHPDIGLITVYGHLEVLPIKSPKS
ncbi:MAG: peptidoglycan DD-metalloendopeptidase family protein [Muribaculaceae bacterium]|nr:peptidoglycan DD-metalloendopeptidase family protein [Muribaculaceae bacterium]